MTELVADEAELTNAAQDAFLGTIQARQAPKEPSEKFHLLDMGPIAAGGMRVLVEDEFTRCFQSAEGAPWNWNLYLFPLWLLGIAVRHLVLLPVRLVIVVVGNLLVALFFFCVCPLIRNDARRLALQKWLLRAYSNMWLASWGAVVRYHGIRPRRHANQVIVANHTTVFDTVLINAQTDTAIIGQKQPGLIGFLQRNFLSATGGVWFDRKDTHDRSFVARRLKEHIQCEDNAALLVFPEGTCVNNEYCIQFKKGAFELGAIIYPVAIKYNRIFCDAFWNSRTQSFVRHIYNLMTSWALVADVWYLDPQVIQPGESSVQFAARVQGMIAEKAGLIKVPWDGYLKYFKPNDTLIHKYKKSFADQLRKKLRGTTPSVSPSAAAAAAAAPTDDDEAPATTPTLPPSPSATTTTTILPQELRRRPL